MMIDRAYQGADLVVDVAWRRLSAEARLGAFRVDGHGVGLDDLGVAAAVALTPAHAPVAVSALGGATLPTGDADAGRGMGHVMVAGGATARVRGARKDLLVRYGGLPCVRIDVQLMYKARGNRPKDQIDFQASLPLLTPEARAWLRQALRFEYAGSHPWLAALE